MQPRGPRSCRWWKDDAKFVNRYSRDETMADKDQTSAPAADTTPKDPPPPRRSRRKWLWLGGFGILVIPLALLALWTLITLSYSYSQGERAGYVQKFSKKGWICKTWEGELAMATMPGTMPEIFKFSVRDDSVASVLTRTMGQRVSITYAQHKGVPTSCFGETEHYVTAVKPLDKS